MKKPPNKIENIDEVIPTEVSACPIGVDIRDNLSNHYSVLTAYFNKVTGKWHGSRRASYPYLSVNITKIDPCKRNKCEAYSADLHLMADSGEMCSLLNFNAVRCMGLEPEKLEKSNVSITGVNEINYNHKQDRCV